MAQAIDSFMDSSEASLVAYANSSSAKPWDKWNAGSYLLTAGSFVEGFSRSDSITFKGDGYEAGSSPVRVGGNLFFETYAGDDYLSITPMSNSFKALYGGGAHDYYIRLGEGNDVITGLASPEAALSAYVNGGDGFDYILEDLSAPGWSISRPYSDLSLATNTLRGTTWRIADSVEAIGSGDLWYLTKDVAQNRLIPLTWQEVLDGGKSQPSIGTKKNKKRKQRGRRRKKG